MRLPSGSATVIRVLYDEYYSSLMRGMLVTTIFELSCYSFTGRISTSPVIMAVLTPEIEARSQVAKLRDILRTNNTHQLDEIEPFDVPVDLLSTLLIHPLAEFRNWAWQCGGKHVMETALDLIWRDHSLVVTYDYAFRLGTRNFYQSYYLADHQSQLSTLEFMLQVAPTIGYPDLKWATVATTELLEVALRNPHLDARYLRRVAVWASSSKETAEEAELLSGALARRQVQV